MSEKFEIQPDSRVRVSTASAGQVDFAVPFPFQRNGDIAVLRIRDGVEALLEEAEDYDLSGAGEPSGGTVTLTEEALAGDVIVRAGRAELDRVTSIVRAGRFASGAIDEDLDRTVLIAQELRRDIDRAPKVKLGETAGPVTPGAAGQLAIWDEGGALRGGPTGDDIEHAQASATIAVEAAGAATAAAGAAAAAAAELNLPSIGAGDAGKLLAVNQAEDGYDLVDANDEAAAFGTRGAVASANIPDGVGAVRTNGYAQPGDGGGGLYRRVDDEPPHAGKVQSADGAWWELAETTVAPMMFGAAGDGDGEGGGTDDTQSFNDALTALGAAGGGIIDLIGRTYRCDGELSLSAHVQIVGPGCIDWSNLTGAEIALSAAGALTDETDLTADGELGGLTLTVGSGDESPFAEGDVVFVRSDARWAPVSWPMQGEFQVVQGTDDGEIALKDGLFDHYVVGDDAKVFKLASVDGIVLDGFEMIGPGASEPNVRGCVFQYLRGAQIRNVRSFGFSQRAFQLDNCIFFDVACNTIAGDQRDSLGYGIVVTNASQWGSVRANKIYSRRRGIEPGGGGSATYGVHRFTTYADNQIIGCTMAGIGCAGNTQHLAFVGNTISSYEDVVAGQAEGILLRGIDCSVTGNAISNCGHGVRFASRVDRDGGHTITGNSIKNMRHIGIYVDPGAGGHADGLVIADNDIADAGTFCIRMITQVMDAGGIRNFAITGNVLRRGGSASFGIQLNASSNSDIEDGVIANNLVEMPGNGDGIDLNASTGDVSRVLVSGNRVLGGTRGIRFRAGGAAPTDCWVVGNYATGATDNYADVGAALAVGTNFGEPT